MMIMKRIIFSSLILISAITCFSQETDDGGSNRSSKKNSWKGFHAGLYLGSLFANNYTSSLYNGYGLDINGKQNDFPNSFMYQRIVMDYGGGNGQTDQVAIALGVDQHMWSFDQTDMPVKMRYNPAFMIGAQMQYGITKKDALILNVNAAKLLLTGNFTIVLTAPPIGPQQPDYQNIKLFTITGGEERLLFQIGYRKTLSTSHLINFFIEAGPSLDLTKFLSNQVAINNLQIDLAAYYTNPYYPTYHPKFLVGAGLGAFAGFGFNLYVNPKLNMELVYTPSYEKINIGEDPKLTLQNSVGVRLFYTL